MIDIQKDINEKESLLIKELYNKFPDVYYTTFITKWNDNTFMIEVRHAEQPVDNICKLHNWTWYKNNITYTNQLIKRGTKWVSSSLGIPQ
jgi:hypothetical protein